MATTTATAFNEFAERIQLTKDQRSAVDSRKSRAGQYLRENFPTSSSLPVSSVTLIGSASRDTIIRPLNDIDVMAEFRNKEDIFEKYRFDSRKFLYRIRNTLEANTQIKTIGARGQAVRLFYQDGVHVDIAPVFAWSSGGYALPSGDGGWLTTNPPAQDSWLSQKNSNLGGKLKRRVRLLKRWNVVHSGRLNSFHLEVMIATVFSSMGDNSREGLRNFFDWGRNYLSINDPAGHSGDLSGYLTSQGKRDVVTSMESAQTRAEKALAAEEVGDHKESIRLWRVLLGDEFPAYG